MTSPDIETAIQDFRHKQRMASFAIVVAVIIVLVAVISVIAYFAYRSRQAAVRAEAQKEQLAQLAAEAHLRSDLRTERHLERAEILQQASGDLQKKVLGIAIDLYEQQPPIPFTWGGKSPKAGFDSSGYVVYTLAQAGVLTHPDVYWSGLLQKTLRPVAIEKRQPGDIVFYSGGACMFYLGGQDDLNIGMLPGGIATGKFDLFGKPEEVGRYDLELAN
jgi:cell wall-associated NlpC family hydrolase